MITAKNYAAQAIKSIYELARKNPSKEDSYSLRDIAKLTEEAVHFVLPDEAKLLNDGLKGLSGVIPRLPFPFITIEYYQKATNFNDVMNVPVDKRLILAGEWPTGDIFVQGIFYYNGFWIPEPCAFAIPPHWDKSRGITLDLSSVTGVKGSDDGKGLALKGPYITCPSFYKTMVNDVGKTQCDKILFHNILPEAVAVLELCEALSCRNISTVNFQDASPKNPARIKAGKLPFYETKMLVVDCSTSISRNNNGAGGTHASPRQHLRRGHIRRLESGNIWVNSCVVGDPSKGSINKQYTVI